MPFVYSPEIDSDRNNKRRKILHQRDMARRPWQDERAQQEAVTDLEPQIDSRKGAGDPPSKVDVHTSDREELIRCIKRGEKPTWIPKPTLEVQVKPYNHSDHQRLAREEVFDAATSDPVDMVFLPDISPSATPTTPHQPIPPPRRGYSTLHSGDFHEIAAQQASTPPKFSHVRYATPSSSASFDSSPPHWLSSPTQLKRLITEPARLNQYSSESIRRTRAPSLGSGLSSSFVMRVPTSPLVHATSNASQDFSIGDSFEALSTSPDETNRRKTLPPETFQSFQAFPVDRRALNFSRPLPRPELRREASMPHQTHQSRRSLTSFTSQTYRDLEIPVLPQRNFIPRSRRQSCSESPLQRASMVGSFEESILRGRMSAPPSKPLDFVAQIGVLGKGDCKPSLRCPPHVSVPFPAVFYSHPAINGSKSRGDDNPSPYVGTIDLEHDIEQAKQDGLKNLSSPDDSLIDVTAPENTGIGRAIAREERERKRIRSGSFKAPPGGSYRVPQQGQLQIIIKNPNKTAVRLYLVPYDLTGMTPGTKTFVRQRSFSTGPIIENVITDKTQPWSPSDPLKDKHILRYLIHLKFCCLGKDRFYLYDNIRVVFANRVPEGKEKLKNEVQLPEPKYSLYKPGTWEVPIGGAGAKLAAEKASKRRSSAFSMTIDGMDAADGFFPNGFRSLRGSSSPMPTAVIPFHIPSIPRRMSSKTELNHQNFELPMRRTEIPSESAHMPSSTSPAVPPAMEWKLSPTPGFRASTSTRSSPVPWTNGSGTSSIRSYSPAPPESGEGLLSRRLRGLDPPLVFATDGMDDDSDTTGREQSALP